MIFITGDIHGDPRRLNTDCFPEQKEMTKNDFVIILGDFGLVWSNSQTKQEKYWLDWLDSKPFTTLFIDGNHDNHPVLNTAFEEVDFHGGKAHKIRDSVYHLMRGYVFDICDKKIFAFGGASSHDIQDGILDPKHFVLFIPTISEIYIIVGINRTKCLGFVDFHGGTKNFLHKKRCSEELIIWLSVITRLTLLSVIVVLRRLHHYSHKDYISQIF